MTLSTTHRVYPRIGIIVVGYNNKPCLRRCFDSVRTLTYPNLEAVYIDNGSTDGSLGMVREDYPEWKVIDSEWNSGYCGGNNQGIQWAMQKDCEFTLILNPDTEVCNPAFLETMIDFMENHPTVGRLGPKVYLREVGQVQNTILTFPSISRRISSWLSSIPSISSCVDCADAIDCDSLNGCCVLVRLDAIREAGLLDERVWAYVDEVDWDFRFMKKGWRRVFLPVESIVHHQRSDVYDLTSLSVFLQARNGAYFYRVRGMWFSFFVWITAKVLLLGGRALAARLSGREGAIQSWVTIAKAFFALIFKRIDSSWFGVGGTRP